MRPPSRTALTGQATRLVAALLPQDWPARAAALMAARHVDRRHGDQARNVVLAAWWRWRAGGPLPGGRWIADLVLDLQEFLSGGLEPRRARVGGLA